MACRFIVSVGVMLLFVSLLRADPPTDDGPEAQDEQAADAGPANLVANGDFELGESSPTGWQAIDGLTSFWVHDRDTQRGRVLRIDTDVRQLQAFDRWKAMRGAAAVEPAPAKQPTVEPKADTLANLDGVAFYSDPIAVEPGKQYVLSLAVRGPPLRVRLVGYADVPDTMIGGEDPEFLRFLAESPLAAGSLSNSKSSLQKPIWRGEMRAGGSNKWTVYSRADKPFQPTKVTPQVRFVRVLLIPAWPPAEYFIDDVRLYETRPR